MNYQIAYVERDRRGRADVDLETVREFSVLSEAMAFARAIGVSPSCFGKPELREVGEDLR